MYTCSNLASESIDAIQKLEGEIGTPLIALSEVAVSPATLKETDLGKVRALEESLGVVLVAVN